MPTNSNIETLLVQQKVITQDQLQEILLSKNPNQKTSEVLLRKGLITEKNLVEAMAIHYGMDHSFHLEFGDNEGLFSSIPTSFLLKNRLVPYKVKKNNVYVALSDPLNIQPLDDLQMLLPDHNLIPVLTTGEEIQRVVHTNYESLKSETTNDVIEDLEESEFEILSSQMSETTDIMDMANDAPIIRLVNTIIKQAVNDRASDIHIEPYEKDLAVRFRIDGILYQLFSPPKKYQSAIISRIKIMSNLNIAENRLPQDGRIQLKIGGKDIDIRVSIFPTHYGERVVMRLLNKTDMSFDLDSIGFSPENLKTFNSLIQKSHGIILVTGPTGSGKSTTLYSVLVRLNSRDVNILTVEDPIEYQLHGIGQMQVKPKIDLTFASGLRSILRQDPDIVMIGEIRDVETAQIAVQASLTGHRVFSTLHTNDAASGITRLIDMGIEPFLIASSVNAFLAQRLVRRICPHCIESYKPSPKLLSELNLKPGSLKNGKLFRGKGCDHCLGTGFTGRTGIYELLPVTQEIRKLILQHADAASIKDRAVQEGMKTLLMDGLDKAINGHTTVEEVLRVS